MRIAVAVLLAGVMLTPTKVIARDFCPERPGLGTPPCIIDKGRISIETGLADWTRDDDSETREDQLLIGATTLRVGVTERAELQIGWVPLGHQYSRDKASNAVERADRVGDVSVGAKLSLLNPDGDKASVALRPQITLPIGRKPIGAGDWAAGLAMPLNIELTDRLSLEATPEIDAAVDEDGRGRHLAFGSVAGVQLSLATTVEAALEVQLMRDDDPSGHATQALSALSVAWQTSDDLQLDVGSAFGINRESPDVRIYAGIARRF